MTKYQEIIERNDVTAINRGYEKAINEVNDKRTKIENEYDKNLSEMVTNEINELELMKEQLEKKIKNKFRGVVVTCNITPNELLVKLFGIIILEHHKCNSLTHYEYNSEKISKKVADSIVAEYYECFGTEHIEE